MKAVPPHLAHRPVRNGLVVPWVTIWTAEFETDNLIQVAMGPDGLVGTRGVRRQYGFLCIDVGNAYQHRGDPVWKGTSSARQRACMTHPRCQVCGNRIKGAPEWIVPGGFGWFPEELFGPRATKQPPLCVPCADVADSWCPHLRHTPYERLTARAVPVGLVATGPTAAGTLDEVIVPLDAERFRPFVLGRELIVRLEPV